MTSSNAKISMKKEHNSIRAVSFQIFHSCLFDNFFYRENKVFASLYITVKINTAIMQNCSHFGKLRYSSVTMPTCAIHVFLRFSADYKTCCLVHVSKTFYALDLTMEVAQIRVDDGTFQKYTVNK